MKAGTGILGVLIYIALMAIMLLVYCPKLYKEIYNLWQNAKKRRNKSNDNRGND